MNLQLKETVKALYGAYAELDPNITLSSFNLEIEKYLSYLASANGTVSEAETDFINYYLDLSLKPRDLANFITSYGTFGKRFETTLPGIYEAHFHPKELPQMYIQVMEKLGKEMIIADERADEEEVRCLTTYLTMLYDAYNEHFPDDKLSYRPEEPESVQPAGDPEEASLNDLLRELDELIGLWTVKQNVYSLIHLQDVQMERKRRGLKKVPISNHLVFTGNPGTGKTTVARLLARIYYRLGVIPSNNFIEADRSTLVAGYVGQTALATKKVLDDAQKGVLFIDEAYSLSSGLQGDYGHESIQTLLKRMEDERDNMVVIVAGYPKLMDDFLNSNPGLRSRFSKQIFFPDYTAEELLEILKYMVRKNGLSITEGAIQYAYGLLKRLYDERDENFANARIVRNMFESALVRQADRLQNIGSLTDEEIQTLVEEDFVVQELKVE